MTIRLSRDRFTLSASAALVGAALLLGGCANTPPEPTFTKTPSKPQLVAKADTVTVSVDAQQGLEILPSDITRVKELIQEQTDNKKLQNATGAPSQSYEVDVHLTDYDPGNAFARFMLAGLGQIHIDAHVSVLSLPDRTEVSAFDISKTFAWGGMMGASTHIQDIEPVFAKGVANAVTGVHEGDSPATPAATQTATQ